MLRAKYEICALALRLGAVEEVSSLSRQKLAKGQRGGDVVP